MVRTKASAPRVAVLTNRIGVFSGNTGGGSAMREKLVAALQREGYDLRLFAAGFHASADVGITDYSPMLLPTWRTLRAIWDVLREADLLIVSGSFTPCMPFGVAAARLLGVRTLVIFTTDSDKVVSAYYTGLQRVMWWWMYSWCDRMVAALATRVYTRTEDFKQKLQELHGIHCEGVMTQSNQYRAFSGHIVDPPEVLQHARRLLSAGRPDLPLLLYAGRWAPEKRIELLAANRPPGMVLAIVYPIKDEAKDDMVLALHDPANGIVCLPEYVNHDQLRIFYKAADVVVSASNFETAGLTAHEALLCGTPVVLQRTGGFVSQVEEGEQGFLVDWANPDDVQVATYRALALRHSGVRPRRLGAVEGTVIVREMMDADPHDMVPRNGRDCAALVAWILRLPFLLLLLSLYVLFPSTWPRSSRASDHNGSWEDAEEEEPFLMSPKHVEAKWREAAWASSPLHEDRHSAQGVTERKTSTLAQVPCVLISLVVVTAVFLLALLLGLLLLTDTSNPAISIGPLALASAHTAEDLSRGHGLAGGVSERGAAGAQGGALGFEEAPCRMPGMSGGWMAWVMAFSAGVALPLTLLSLLSVAALLVLACVLLSVAKTAKATKEGAPLSVGMRAEGHKGYMQPLRAHGVCTRLDAGCNRVWLFDTTLRDGGQTSGVDFSVADKIAIARELDDFGIDYIEGGWPGANPTDTQFFRAAGKALELKHAKLVAFGMTRRAGCCALEDPGLLQVLRAPTHGTCIFGKTWDFQVETALKVSLEENLAMIADSVRAIAAHGREPMFDCEHFFDGYKANPDYAVACARTAHEAGAKWVVLCDTNGGSMPDEVHRIVSALRTRVEGIRLGIHCHNDCGLAVANSLAAVAAGKILKSHDE
jgi:glycosyltransferase involved in cell wall biosynthesis